MLCSFHFMHFPSHIEFEVYFPPQLNLENAKDVEVHIIITFFSDSVHAPTSLPYNTRLEWVP